MRIVAGTYRGRTIAAPDGDGTRPTIDRVREALFSSLYSMRGGFEGAIVLDAFAGSGALALEALSRGAESAVLCEADRKVVQVIKKNIAACGVDSKRIDVQACDVFKACPRPLLAKEFDLVFLDPPYDYESDNVLGFVEDLRNGGMIGDEAIIVYEHAMKARDDVDAAAEAHGLEVASKKKYGKTAITLLGISR